VLYADTKVGQKAQGRGDGKVKWVEDERKGRVATQRRVGVEEADEKNE